MGYYTVYSDELYHYGVLGMKWGVIRSKTQRAAARAGVAAKNVASKTRDKVQTARVNAQVEKYRRSNPTLGRQTYEGESLAVKKRKVEANRKEAADRIKFYGGKNVALDRIEAESSFAQRVEKGKGRTEALLRAAGGIGSAAVTAGAAYAYSSVGLLAAAGGMLTAGGVGVALSIKATRYAVNAIKRHANEQIAYTKDSDAGADIVVTNRKDD